MKEHPLLFNSWSIQRILTGAKTMTRRPNPERYRTWLVGDRIWARETFALWIPGCPMPNGITYRANHQDPQGDGPANPIKWTPSIYMHRHESRILLEITELREEPVRDITNEDATAEGVEVMHRPESVGGGTYYLAPECGDRPPYWEISPVIAFVFLWDSINAKRGFPWGGNPQVKVFGFKVLSTERNVETK